MKATVQSTPQQTPATRKSKIQEKLSELSESGDSLPEEHTGLLSISELQASDQQDPESNSDSDTEQPNAFTRPEVSGKLLKAKY